MALCLKFVGFVVMAACQSRVLAAEETLPWGESLRSGCQGSGYEMKKRLNVFLLDTSYYYYYFLAG